MKSESTGPALNWVVLKVSQRCNLNCSYCYVFNRGDYSWTYRPAFISEDVVNTLAHRIVEQCSKYSLDWFVIELHGGEPLLLGKAQMRRLVELLRRECASIDLRIVIQTNGLLLDQEWLELFDENGIPFGLSLDGPPELADKFRVRHDGRGSTQALLKNIETLRAYGPLFDRLHGGTLCVINPESDGAEMVRWFVDQGFKAVDFLLPHGNYVDLPAGWTGPEPYLQFLLNAFEEWYSMGERAPHIRTFELMIRGFMGAELFLDSLGGDLRRLCVVESDGSIGLSDVARFLGGEYSKDSLNVFDHPLDLHATHYRIEEIQRPCAQCLRCPYFDSCRGGYLPHRFDGESFDNPSLYCDVLFQLADTIYHRLRADVPFSLWKVKNGA